MSGGREANNGLWDDGLHGGCCVSDTVHFMVALYMVGENEKANRVLNAMLDRQHKGLFPNGGGFRSAQPLADSQKDVQSAPCNLSHSFPSKYWTTDGFPM